MENIELDAGENLCNLILRYICFQNFDDELNQTVLKLCFKGALKIQKLTLTFKAKQWLDKFGAPYDLILQMPLVENYDELFWKSFCD